MTVINYYTVRFCSGVCGDSKAETVCVSNDDQIAINLAVAFNYFIDRIKNNMEIDFFGYEEAYELFKELDKKYEFSKSYNSYFVCEETTFVGRTALSSTSTEPMNL